MIEKIAEIIENNSGDIAYGYSNETSAEFRKCILTPLAGRIHQLILSHYSQAEEVLSEEFEEKLTELSTNLNGCAYPMGQETCRYPDDGDCVRCFSDQIKEFIQSQAAHSRLKYEAEKEQAVKAERERIIKWIKEHETQSPILEDKGFCYYIEPVEFEYLDPQKAQALKGEG